MIESRGEAESVHKLQFSTNQAAFHALLAGGLAGTSLYLTLQFMFHFDSLPEGSVRRAWVWALLKTGDGWPGVMVWLVFSCISLWWSFRAVWRLLTERATATFSNKVISLHTSFVRGARISSNDLEEVTIYEEASARLFEIIPPMNSLLIRWTDRSTSPVTRRRVKIRSNTIEGGTEALNGFARVLRLTRRSGC